MSIVNTRQPALFVSHGAPTLVLDPGATGLVLQSFAAAQPAPRAVVVISAHWETREVTVGAAAHPETIHDFYGFPDELYRLQYPAPGDAALSQEVAQALRDAGPTVEIDATRGLDHGAWVPLMLMYPQANVPVVPVSVQPQATPAAHCALGRALAALRDEGVLILASGSATHNLRAIDWSGAQTAPAWVSEFNEWIAERLAAHAEDDLLHYRERAPHAARNHPTPEHLLPLFVALGAGDKNRAPERLHTGYTFGVIGMDIYRFN